MKPVGLAMVVSGILWGAFIGLRPATSEFSRAQRTLDGPRRSPVRSEPVPVLRGAGTARPVKEG